MVFLIGATEQVTLGGSRAINFNSPTELTLVVLAMSVFGAIIPTAFLSSGVLRDYGFKTAELFHSRPVDERTFVLGRFLGGFLITAVVFASVPLAFLVATSMPWLDPERIGPTNLGWYAYMFVVGGLVNMLSTGTILFTVANLTRSTILTYTAFIGLLILWVVGNFLSAFQPDLRDLFAIVDPFGLNAFGEITRYWTISEQNSQIVPLEGVFLTNRLLWLGISVALLVVNVLTFRFRAPGGAGLFGRSRASVESSYAIGEIRLPRMTPRTDVGAAFSQFMARLGFEVKGVVFNVAFWILLAFALLNTIPGLILGSQFYGTANFPVTRVMFSVINSNFAWFPLVVIIYYAAEVMWRERRVGFSEIVDATPTPSWVFVTTKFFALCVVVAALALLGVVAAVTIQLIRGYTAIELDQYLIRSLVEIIVPFSIFAALAVFVQVLFNNRWLGMGVMIAYLLARGGLATLGYDHLLYNYGNAPGTPYSDMNGYGHFVGIAAWFYTYWAFWAVLLLALSYALWTRGIMRPIAKRVLALPRAFTPATGMVALIAVIGAGATGGWIFYNTNILNTYISGPDQRGLAAEYERQYLHLQDLPQPTIIETAYDVDIYPEDRRYTATGHYVLENKEDTAIDTLWISYGQGTTIVSQELEGGSLATSDEGFYFYSFDLGTPLEPGETRRFDFTVERNNPGFRNSGNVGTVNHNGTFFNNSESMPNIGFNSNWRLTDRQQRRREGLEPIERAYPLEDESRWYENGITNSDYVTFRTTVSTAPGQIAVAPGYLAREWEEDGRPHFEYVMDRPILNFYSWLSAEYEVAERETDGILYQVFHHPDHAWNVERMLEAGEDSIGYFSEHLSPYQYRQYRILEFPAYATFAQAFPNTIPFSEGIGFIADLSDPQDIDYVYYVTAHEAAHQWWAHQVMSANVQGGTMLIETFAQYSALMVMRQEYGEDHMRRFLKYELDSYLSGRGSEAIEEQPLYRVENQQYIHYRKGAVIMYALQDYVGEDVVNRAMQRLIAERAFQGEPYATTLDFLRLLREEAGPEHEAMIHDFFERIVLFDLNVTSATASERTDGRWDLVLEIEAHKFEADGAGEQTEEAIDYMIDIGVFTENLDDAYEGSDHVLYMDKHRINETTMRIELIVDEQPLYAGIDPYNKLIDRNSDDNLMPVTIE
ncbi:ABC transporter permease/M1 family aminopeptidase [Maricaulis sp.]|uniref:ABC transporter permease/M1 family aminopeptidase n=1 Tax=Maricaulis sp. TaxID=1486257 RepID=UPI003A91AE0C